MGRSTAVASRPAFITLVVLSGFSLWVSQAQLPVLCTVLLLPGAALVAYMLARVDRGIIPVGLRNSSRVRPEQNNPWMAKRFTLVAHPINHYGEKLRWCMDLIGAQYEESNVGAIVMVLFRGRSVPWLQDLQSDSHIGNSDEALMYLNGVHVPTLPEGSRQLAELLLCRSPQALQWEPKLSTLGHLVQGWAYFHILQADPLFGMTCWGAFEDLVPWFDRMAVRMFYKPLLVPFMRMAFKHTGAKAEAIQAERKTEMDGLFDQVDAALAKNKHILGEHLSYVDITFCSLIAPMFATTLLGAERSEYAAGRFKSFDGFVSSNNELVPEVCRELEQELLKRPCGQYVVRMYKEWRTNKLVV